MEQKIDNLKTKLLKDSADFVQASDKQKFTEKMSKLLNTELEKLKIELGILPNIQREFAKAKNCFFVATQNDQNNEEISTIVKEILTHGLDKKTDGKITDAKKEIEKFLPKMINNPPVKIPLSDKTEKKDKDKEKKKVGCLYKISLTNKKINFSDDTDNGYFPSQIFLEGLSSYNRDKEKKEFVQVTREIPHCAKQHVKKLNEIAYKLRKKNYKTRHNIDFKTYRYTIEIKKADEDWQRLAEVAAALKTVKKDWEDSIKIPYIPYEKKKDK